MRKKKVRTQKILISIPAFPFSSYMMWVRTQLSHSLCSNSAKKHRLELLEYPNYLIKKPESLAQRSYSSFAIFFFFLEAKTELLSILYAQFLIFWIYTSCHSLYNERAIFFHFQGRLRIPHWSPHITKAIHFLKKSVKPQMKWLLIGHSACLKKRGSNFDLWRLNLTHIPDLFLPS